MPDENVTPSAKPQTKERVVAAHHGLMMAVKTVLPSFIDDVTRDFGRTKYEEMLRDYEVGGDFDTLKLSVLDDGWKVLPAVEMPLGQNAKDAALVADATKAKEIADFVTRCFDQLETEFTETCHQILDAVAWGWRVAEVCYKYGDGDDSRKIVLKAIKPKPQANVGLVVDPFANVLGIIGATVDTPMPPTGTLVSSINGPILLGRDRVLLYSYAPVDGDPRGSSILRLAYMPWFVKNKVIPEWYKYLRRFGEPAIVGKVSPDKDAVPKVDDVTGEYVLDGQGNFVTVAAEWALREELLKYINGLVLALPAGYEVDLLESSGEGMAFASAMEWCDRAIARAILGTAQMTQEAQHESRSSKKTSQNVADLRTKRLRGQLGAVIRRDVVRPLVQMNFGRDGLRLMPWFVFSDVAEFDFTERAGAIAQLKSAEYLHWSQFPELDAWLGLPPRDMEAMKAEAEDQRLMDRLRGQQIDALNENDPPERGGAQADE